MKKRKDDDDDDTDGIHVLGRGVSWTMQDSVWTPRGPCVGSVDAGQMSFRPPFFSFCRSFCSSNPRYKNMLHSCRSLILARNPCVCVCVCFGKSLLGPKTIHTSENHQLGFFCPAVSLFIGDIVGIGGKKEENCTWGFFCGGDFSRTIVSNDRHMIRKNVSVYSYG